MKTPVELFAIALYECGYLQGKGDEIQQLLEHHLEMEKEHIEKAVNHTIENIKLDQDKTGFIAQNGDGYFNETYGGNK